MNGKRNSFLKRQKSVPKKRKVLDDKNPPQTESAETSKLKDGKSSRPRRSPALRKSRLAGSKTKSTRQRAGRSALDETAPREPSEEEIRTRAYFISEHRRRFGLPGDAESDWLEAKRQLLTEAPR
jgi:hypothetical protein